MNRIALAPVVLRQAALAQDPASPAGRARTEERGPVDAASEILSRARRAEMESLLTSMASAPPGADKMAAHILQEAERTLGRLKAEARAAAASGDRKAARAIARDLAVLARRIADAAQDYAVAQARPDVVSPALAKAAARMNLASPRPEAGGAVDTGGLLGEATAAAAEMAQVAASPENPDTVRPDSTAYDAEDDEARQPADLGLASVAPPLSGSGGAHEEDILVKAHRLFEEAVDLMRALEALAGGRSCWAGCIGLAAPTVLPVWPVAIVPQPAVGALLPAATHGR